APVVTAVRTCALPIWMTRRAPRLDVLLVRVGEPVERRELVDQERQPLLGRPRHRLRADRRDVRRDARLLHGLGEHVDRPEAPEADRKSDGEAKSGDAW